MTDPKGTLINALHHLVTVSNKDSTKGKYVTSWFADYNDSNGRSAHVTDKKQVYNRPDEQLRHEPDYAIFVVEGTVDFVPKLEAEIKKRVRSNLKAVWILKRLSNNSFEGCVHLGDPETEIARLFDKMFPGMSNQLLSASSFKASDQTDQAKQEDSPLSEALVRSFVEDCAAVSLNIPAELALRFAASLLAKRFVILTGLAGSGKTKLAQAFAQWITPDPGDIDPSASSKGKKPNPRCTLIPVGADWIGSENMIGYPDGLRPPKYNSDGSVAEHGAYISRPSLDLILRAVRTPSVPHFLVLDEMNLSHVERYFADMLSLMESRGSITLYRDADESDGSPKITRMIDPVLRLPDNLFVIGTVNVDETTYMFSPKVLDRASVIEFQVTPEDMSLFLQDPKRPNLNGLDGRGSMFMTEFSTSDLSEGDPLTDEEEARFRDEMNFFFVIFQEHGAEFGYRVAHEAARFMCFNRALSGGRSWRDVASDDSPVSTTTEVSQGRDWFDDAFDAVIVQKFLPKLHGSKVKLERLLKSAFAACLAAHSTSLRTVDSIADKIKAPLQQVPPEARYPISAGKIFRMWRQLNDNGFTSF